VSLRARVRAWPRGIRLGAGFVLFQAAWFACVIGAAEGNPLAGIVAVAVVVTLLVATSDAPRRELALVVLAMLVGFVWDSALARWGIVRYASPIPSSEWAPYWILALWALLAPMLRDPLRWLHGRPGLAALVGAVGGPLSYAGAVRLAAGEFADPALALAVLAIGWGGITPLLVGLARRLERAASGPGS
jgi:hypothetical protein